MTEYNGAEFKPADELEKQMFKNNLQSYINTQEQIPLNIIAYRHAINIGQSWIKFGEDHHFKLDIYTPFYLKLKMNATDDLCKECMLFLEEMEDIYGEFYNMDPLLSSPENFLLKFKNKNNSFELIFIAHKETKCEVVLKKKSRTTFDIDSREVICY